MDDPAALDPEDAARLESLADAARDIVAGAADDDADGVGAALSQFRQIASQVDHDAVLNATQTPADAGVWAPELAGLLRRIPDGWGRWIECDRGWYPILGRLEQRLSALAAGWQLHQVKEKYGTLRVYMSVSPGPVQDPSDPQPEHPGARAADDAKQAWRAAHRAWCERRDAWSATAEGVAAIAEANALSAAAERIVAEAERAAARTCERCGEPGRMHRTKAPSPWLKTLCGRCAGEDHLTPEAWEVWWEAEKPHHRARMRALRVKYLEGSRLLVASADQELLAAVPADYVRDPAAVAAALGTGGFDELWIGPDPAGQAAIAWLATRFAGHDPRAAGRPTGAGGHVLAPPPEAPSLCFWSTEGLDTAPLRDLAITWRYADASFFAEGRSPVADD